MKTGRTIGIVTGRSPPAPPYVPTGYRQTFARPFTVANGLLGIRQFVSGDHSIEIRLRSATAWAQTGRVIARTHADGRAVTVTQESYERCATWSDGQHLVNEVCSLAAHRRYLSVDQLERIVAPLAR